MWLRNASGWAVAGDGPRVHMTSAGPGVQFDQEAQRLPPCTLSYGFAAHGHSCCCRGLWLQGVYETRGDSARRRANAIPELVVYRFSQGASYTADWLSGLDVRKRKGRLIFISSSKNSLNVSTLG